MKTIRSAVAAVFTIIYVTVIIAELPVMAGTPVKTFSAGSDRIMSVAISPDGRYILAGSENNVVRLWDVTTGNLVRTVKDDGGLFSTVYVSVAFTPDGGRAVIGVGNNNVGRRGSIEVYDLTSGRLLYKDDEVRAVSALAVSPDGKTILYGSWGASLRLRDMATGKDIRSFEGHTDEVWCVAFSPDGKSALSGSWDKTLKLWDVTTGREIRSFTGHSGMVWAAAFSPDGKRAVSGSVGISMWSEGEIKLWNTATGAELVAFKSKSRNINSLRFSPDGRYVISGSDLEPPKLWDASSGELVAVLGDSADSVLSVAFSKSGKLAVSGTSDGSVKLWDISGISGAGKSSAVAAEKPAGIEIGLVQEFRGGTVLIGGSEIGSKVKIGDILLIDTGEGVIKIKAEFPMMTTAKCSFVSGPKSKIRKGLPVYAPDK